MSRHRSLELRPDQIPQIGQPRMELYTKHARRDGKSISPSALLNAMCRIKNAIACSLGRLQKIYPAVAVR